MIPRDRQLFIHTSCIYIETLGESRKHGNLCSYKSIDEYENISLTSLNLKWSDRF